MRNLITAQEYCSSVFDGTHATPKPQKCGKPLVTSKHILNGKLDIANAYNISEEDYLEINKRSKVHQWDILFSMIGTIGTIYLEKSEHISYAIKNIGVFSCRHEKKARYLYYFLQTNFAKRHIQKQLAGAVQKFLSLGELRKFPVFSFDERSYKNISILNNLDEKIELNNKISSEFEQFARTLYDYWFVQFDFPDEFGRPYKSSGGKMIYNEVLKREIPEGWNASNFYSNPLTTVIQPGIEVFGGDKVYLPTASVQGDKIIDCSNEITFQDRESRANMQPTPNSVWFAKMKNSKKILLVGNYATEYLNKFIFSTGFCGLACQEIALEYMWNTINSSYFENRKDILAHGATQEAIGNDDLKSIPLLIPAKSLLKLYHQRTKHLYHQKYVNEAENRQLILLRDFLLPMLMNGQVSVKN